MFKSCDFFHDPFKRKSLKLYFFRSRAVLFWDIFGWVSEFDPHLHWRSKIFKGYLLTNLGYVLPRQIAWQWLTRKFKTNKLFRGYLFEGFSPYMFDSPICSKFHAKHIKSIKLTSRHCFIFRKPKRSPNFCFTQSKIPCEWGTPGVSCWNKTTGFLKRNPLEIWDFNNLCLHIMPDSEFQINGFFFLVTPPKKNYMRWLNDLLNLRNLIEQYQTYAPVVKLNLDHLPQGYQGKRYHQKKIFQQKQPPQEIQ